MAINTLPIVIAGGGIGGLATALALAKHGIASEIHERREVFEEDGAGIQLGPNATKALTALGLAHTLSANVSVPDALTVHDGTSGRALTRLPLGSWISARHGSPYWSAHRQDLHAALLQKAQSSSLVSIHSSAEVSACDQRGDSVVARLRDGSEINARALIAADGLWSKLRTAVAPSAQLTPTGKCAYRTVVSRGNLPGDLAHNDVHIWLSQGMHAVHYPVRGGREIALVVIIDEAASANDWTSEAQPMWHNSKASRFPSPLRELLQIATGWRMWPLQTLTPLESWTNGRAALLGDAAHPVLPFLAQGGALALEDALIVANAIATTPNDIPAALKTYDAERRPRAMRVAAASERNGRAYHLAGPMARARNAVLRAASPERLMRQYDWLYGWTP